MVPQFPLERVAEIRSGFQFRSRIQPEKDGEVFIVQMKDVIPPFVSTKELVSVKVDKDISSFLVGKGDVLFSSRGFQFYGAMIHQDLSQTTIASAPLFILRPHRKKVLPEYLVWYMNSTPGQKYFTSRAGGTVVKLVTMKALKEMGIPIPSLKKQRLIVEIFYLMEREKGIIEELKQNRQKLLEVFVSTQKADKK